MKQYKDKLYIKDQLGKIREWYLTYDESTYVKNYGILNGETIRSVTNVWSGKNIGRSCATSVSTQILKECESEYKRQRKLGYKSLDDLQLQTVIVFNYKDLYIELNSRLSSSKTDENNYLKPMKAQKYKTDSIKFPCIVQPKINGVRSTCKQTNISEGLFGNNIDAEFKSKEGLVYNIEHLKKYTREILKYPELVLDGELYISGIPITTIGGAARNKSNEYHKELAYIIFDLSVPNLSQIERLDSIDVLYLNNPSIINKLNINRFCELNKLNLIKNEIYICPSIIVDSEEEIINWAKYFIDNGFEGAIIRDIKAEYNFGGRVRTMRKLKYFEDSEFIILDIVPGEKDGKPIFICKNDINNLTFRVDGTVEFLDMKILEEKTKYIGKPATVKFYERTKNGLPFHTTLIAIRDYE